MAETTKMDFTRGQSDEMRRAMAGLDNAHLLNKLAEAYGLLIVVKGCLEILQDHVGPGIHGPECDGDEDGGACVCPEPEPLIAAVLKQVSDVIPSLANRG